MADFNEIGSLAELRKEIYMLYFIHNTKLGKAIYTRNVALFKARLFLIDLEELREYLPSAVEKPITKLETLKLILKSTNHLDELKWVKSLTS